MAHDHEHAHSHAPADFGRAFLIGISLNLTFVVVEVGFGIVGHSMALVADAGHNLSDVLGLALAWGASALAKRKASQRHTYGLKRASILAALANAVLLLAATGAVVWEAVGRLANPGNVEGKTMIVVASAGVVINGFSALLFARGRDGDLNIRSAFLHLLGDAALAMGVVVAGVIILFTRWTPLDPIVSIVLSLAIVASTWSLLRRSLDLVLDAVPENVDLPAVRAYLEGIAGVQAVHDLHVWAMSTTEAALTAHVVVTPFPTGSGWLNEICEVLHERFGIEHSTLQVESASEAMCSLAKPNASH